MNTNNLTQAIIGLGCVGFPLAVEFGKKCKVIGFDINQRRIDELMLGTIPPWKWKPSCSRKQKA